MSLKTEANELVSSSKANGNLEPYLLWAVVRDRRRIVGTLVSFESERYGGFIPFH